ncbi:MAG: hypothetical protein U0W40_13200 [Acidimicrobiia bacterium]
MPPSIAAAMPNSSSSPANVPGTGTPSDVVCASTRRGEADGARVDRLAHDTAHLVDVGVVGVLVLDEARSPIT